MNGFLNRYPPPGAARREAEAHEGRLLNHPRRPRPNSAKRLPIEDSLDLHGMTWEEARRAIESFLRGAVQSGKRKVLIIHGKGRRENSAGVLRRNVREYVQDHPLIAESGEPEARDGGAGAVWVAVRYRSR